MSMQPQGPREDFLATPTVGPYGDDAIPAFVAGADYPEAFQALVRSMLRFDPSRRPSILAVLRVLCDDLPDPV